MNAFLAKWRFLKGYTLATTSGGSHEDGVAAGFTNLSTKAPFNVLTEADIKRLAPVVAIIPDPRGIIPFIANIVKQNDAKPLKDKWLLKEMAKKYRAINRANEMAAKQ